MSDIEWSALCSFFSIPFPIYLAPEKSSPKELWQTIAQFKKWEAEDLEKHQGRFYKEFEFVHRTKFLTWHDPLYPLSLRNLFSPPPCLYYWGNLELLNNPRLAVVGSRYPSSIFVDWMSHELGGFLRSKSCAIVSGGAVGVDQMATRVALRQGSPSVVVVPSGIDCLYPRGIESWKDDPNVLFISEYLPRQEMYRHHFVKRNRIIAGLSDQLLVVQCAIKSGSMITVNYALELGLPIATIPDFPGRYESSGNLKLLQEGAHFVAQAQDLDVFVKDKSDSIYEMGSNDRADAFAKQTP